MTSSDKEYHKNGYQPLFDLMSQHGLTLLESEMYEIINCVRKIDEAQSDTMKVTLLPLNEISEIFYPVNRILKVGLVDGSEKGLLIEYHDKLESINKVKLIKTKPSY